jgi:hypothetical protein
MSTSVPVEYRTVRWHGEQVFAVFVVAVVNGVADVLACLGELLGGWRGWWWAVEQFGQLGASVWRSASLAHRSPMRGPHWVSGRMPASNASS